MQKQLKNPRKSTDENEIAFDLVRRSTEEPASVPASVSAYMAQIGAKGGRIGGKRRLKTMTAEQRSKIAKKAAKARWK